MEEIARRMNMYHMVFIACAALAGLFLLISIFIFIRYRIVRVIGELSGTTAKKTIKQLEEENSRTGKLQKRKKALSSQEKEILRDIISPSGNLKTSTQQSRAVVNTVIPDQPSSAGGGITEVLEQAQDISIPEELNETTVLSGDLGTPDKPFVLLKNVILIHTSEEI